MNSDTQSGQSATQSQGGGSTQQQQQPPAGPQGGTGQLTPEGVQDFLGGNAELTGDMVATILEQAKDNPSLAELPEVQSLIQLANEKAGQQGQAQGQGQQSGQTQQGQSQQSQTQQGQQGQQQGGQHQQQTDQPDHQLSGPFFKNQQGGDDTPSLSPEYIKNKYSIDAAEDPGKFFNSVNTWRKDSQKLGEVSKQFEALTKELQALPPEIANAISRYNQGDENWQVALTGKGLDLSKPFSSQDPETVLNNYFPGEFTSEDLKDLSDPQVKRALSAAQVKFQADAEREKFRRDQLTKQAERDAELFKDSVTASMNSLSEEFPGFDDSELSKVEELLKENKIVSIFYNSDGSLKKDAAVKLSLALYGKEQMESLANSIRSKRTTDDNVQRVSQSPDKPRGGQGGQSVQSPAMQDPQVARSLSMLSEMTRKKVY